MIITGYQVDDAEREFSTMLTLREGTISCTIDEVDKIIEFLRFAKEEYEFLRNHPEPSYHFHYSEWNKEWTCNSSDFIISIPFNNNL